MRHLFQRHPLPVKAFFRHSLVLTYAFPEVVLTPLLPPGLQLDTFQGFGFVAIAMVQTEGLRPAFLPPAFGQNFFLTGYRIFTRFPLPDGRRLRGLRILRSDTDNRLMAFSGNLLTHYRYKKAAVAMTEEDGKLEIVVATPGSIADLHVVADLETAVAPPDGSPFSTLKEARRFAGPLPFTFDYEVQTHSIVVIEGVRQNWQPRPVRLLKADSTFLTHEQFGGITPVLANAFHVSAIPYMWKRGVRYPLEGRKHG